VTPIVRRRRAEAEPGGDLLGALLRARDDEGRSLADEEVRDELFGLLLGAHETTATAVSWSLYLLSKHPEAERSVRAEIDGIVGARTLELADLARLPFTRAAIEEAMRLYPPAWILFREALADDVVSGRAIPKGSLVLPCIWTVHRSDRTWERPLRYDPSRFLPHRRSEIAKGAFVPFALGPHQCIANHFAMTEMLVMLVEFLRRFRFRLTDRRVRAAPAGTLAPHRGVALDLTRTAWTSSGAAE
jgi:cytochrome P450